MGVDVRALRIRAGMTQKDVAAACGVSVRTLIRWEQGDSDDIPHGRYVRLVGLLDETIRFRKEKEAVMAHMHGKTAVVFDDPNEAEDEDGYTVPIPEGLTKEFKPSREVTNKQMIAWAVSGKEPYPGFAEECARWDAAWSRVASEQREKDTGHADLRVPSVHPQPEQDEDGRQYMYDNEAVINEINDPEDAENGDAHVYIPQDAEGNDLEAPEPENEEDE